MRSPPDIQRGRVILYRLFAVSDAINLDLLRQAWGDQSQTAPLVSRRQAPQYIQFQNPPLTISLGDRPLAIAAGKTLTASVRAKIFDYGVVSLAWEVPAPSTWEALLELTCQVSDNPLVDPQSRQVLDELRPRLVPGLLRPYPFPLIEDYLVTYLQEFSREITAEELVAEHRSHLAQLIRGESSRLSPTEQDEALRQQISYYTDDLVIIDWNAAVIYDRAGSTEHVDILEFANSELVELRYYDALLDRELDEIYRTVAPGVPFRVWAVARYQRTSQQLMVLMVDVVELTERIENALKIIGDLYSARVYRAISARLRLREWEENIEQKLRTANQIYSVIIEQVNTGRFVAMELVIILLIVLETVFLFVGIPHH